MDYRNLSVTNIFPLIRNLKKVSDLTIKKIFYNIKDEISEEEKEKALYLLKIYRPNLVKEGRIKG